MGQGAQFTVVNGTPYAFKRVQQDSYQMNNWNFPDQVGPFSSQNVYIEWNQSIFHTTGDDQGNVTFQIDTGNPGDNLTFKLHAAVVNDNFHIYASCNFNSQTLPANTSVDLGWIHDGTMSYGVTGDRNSQFIATGFNASAWMQNNLGTLGGRTLANLCIPGSHDSGMSTLGSATAFSFPCNTQTQTRDIAAQLNLGIRYFDIRPVIGGGQYYTGHYSKVINTTWQGARGQSISDIIANINSFTANHNELVVLNLSHAYNTDAGNSDYPPFTAAQWNGLLNQLRQLNHLYVAQPGETPDFTKMTLASLIQNSPKVLVILEGAADGTDLGNCFFPYSSFNAYNSYAGSNELSQMASDQIRKMQSQKAGGAYFLLSWTLTQSDSQAATCFIDPTGQTSSILDLANQADQNLFAGLTPAITTTVFPNIVYIDNVADSNAALLSMYVNTLTQAR